MRNYSDYLARGKHQHGDRFTAAQLAPRFIPYFTSGQRIRVVTTYGSGETYTRTGIVGATTGWVPAFLLMHRSSDHGSSDVLSDRDVVTHVQVGRTYVPVSS